MEIPLPYVLEHKDNRMEMSQEEFLDWLPKQSPDTWHEIVTNWNWDDGSKPLFTIVSQPSCDFGSAYYIFFVEASNWMTDLSPDELDYEDYRDSWHTCKLIAERWQRKDFRSAELNVNLQRYAENYRKAEKNALDSGRELAWTVPDYVYNYAGSREHKTDYKWLA